MRYTRFNDTLTVDCVLPAAGEVQITGTVQGIPSADNAVVCSVYPCIPGAFQALAFGFTFEVGKDSNVLTINAVANSIYKFITEKALHFATVVTAVVSRIFVRKSARIAKSRPVPVRKKLHSKVLLSCAGGLRL